MEIFSALFSQLFQDQGAGLVLLLISVVAIALETSKLWPDKWNGALPLLCLAAGAAIYPFTRSTGTVSPNFPHPMLILVITGIIVGFVAFTIHKTVGSWIAGYIKIKFQGDDNGPPSTPKVPLLLGVAIISLALFTVGCGSTPLQNAAKADAAVVMTVDQGMTAWSKYVNAGNATQAQVDAVHKAYDTYYNSQLVAKAAFESAIASSSTNSTPADTTTVQNAVNASKQALINLITQYMPTNSVP